MAGQEPVRKGLIKAGENLIGQISGPNASKVTETINEIEQVWVELEVTVATRNKGINTHTHAHTHTTLCTTYRIGCDGESCGGASGEGGRV